MGYLAPDAAVGGARTVSVWRGRGTSTLDDEGSGPPCLHAGEATNVWHRRMGSDVVAGRPDRSQPIRSRAFTVALAVAACGSLTAGCSNGHDVDRSATPTTSSGSAPTAASSTSQSAGGTTGSTASTTAASSVDSTTSTSSAGAPEGSELALAARARDFFAVRMAANSAPVANPDSPLLAEVATGDALGDLRAEASERRDAGQAVRAASPNVGEIRVGFVQVSGATASLSVCRVDDSVVYELATGNVANATVATQNYTLELALVDGQWMVSGVTQVQRWEGVAGCALADADFPY